MDALPVFEQTGLSYASSCTAIDLAGAQHPVMHACGHDMHVTCALAAAEILANTIEAWSETAVVLIQPDEEGGRGADAMIADGLFEP
ncbi:hypothetical protein BP5796_09840 [Coleophoma crateriformis]|uniref:Peptidase M20 dimerisation domain-containing protein n=1 Tax=Coleophoma crateriformis TaxID=565419 RepID=A0A3D8QTY9_9HELO|nr:hypothetical protein BP5796_09840 [Coleophoma crateriformis]